MKKRIMLSIGVLAIAVVVSLNLNLAKTDSSSLAFMNIQALAGETGGGGESGSGKKCYQNSSETISTVYNKQTKVVKLSCGTRPEVLFCSTGEIQYEKEYASWVRTGGTYTNGPCS